MRRNAGCAVLRAARIPAQLCSNPVCMGKGRAGGRSLHAWDGAANRACEAVVRAGILSGMNVDAGHISEVLWYPPGSYAVFPFHLRNADGSRPTIPPCARALFACTAQG